MGNNKDFIYPDLSPGYSYCTGNRWFDLYSLANSDYSWNRIVAWWIKNLELSLNLWERSSNFLGQIMICLEATRYDFTTNKKRRNCKIWDCLEQRKIVEK